MPKGNGEDAPIKIRVADRRHHAQPADEAGAAGAPEDARLPSFVEQLKARTEAAEKKAREAIARAQTEIDAVRARLERDLERRVTEGKSELLARILDLADNLDLAARHAAETSPAIGEGIDLVRQKLLSILRSEGVEPIETLGLEYDPHVAEAVVTEPVEAARDHLVLEELQRGYRYGERVLRPARVKVGKASL